MRHLWPPSNSARRMGGAKRYPSIADCEYDGFREGLNLSYSLKGMAASVARMSGAISGVFVCGSLMSLPSLGLLVAARRAD
jgi:hypothetical protein